MPTIATKDQVEIFYKDWGSGQPIVFSHGWPLSSDDWNAQMHRAGRSARRLRRARRSRLAAFPIAVHPNAGCGLILPRRP